MRESSIKIADLCEAWWERMADSTRCEQHRYIEALLKLLDWDQPIPFSAKEGASSLSATPYLLRAAGQTTVAAYFVMPGTLDPPTAVVERGLDFCGATRIIVDEAGTLNVNYTLVSDLYRAYLYDVRTDELLLYADDPQAFTGELGSVLKRANMERGSIEEIRRNPRSAVARQLREWCHHWVEILGSRHRLPEESASLVIDRLLVMRYLFDRNIMGRTRSRLEERFRKLTAKAAGPAPEGTGAQLVKLFHDMCFDWRVEVFEAAPDIDRALEDDAIAAPLLKEFALLSRGKFSIATILEGFNYGDPAEKMRVRMVPDINEERELYLYRQTLGSIDSARIQLDLIEEGYRAIFHWFDAVTALYERLEVDFDAKTYINVPQAQELDLFEWSEMDSNRPSACQDKIAHACEHGFGIYYSGTRQYRVARLMLILHMISRYTESHQAVSRFPSLKNALMPRPQVLPSDRVFNMRPPSDPKQPFLEDI